MLDDRLTEQRNPRSAEIDGFSALEIVDLINSEDQLVAKAVSQQRIQIAKAIELVTEAFLKGGRLIYVGAGTSGRLGVLDASEMPPTFGSEPELVQGIIAGGFSALVSSKESEEDSPSRGSAEMDTYQVAPNDFVLGIAASGTTPFVHGALSRACERGAKTGILLCTKPKKSLQEKYEIVIAILVGPEVVTGSTRMKAGTATKMVLNTISTGAMVRTGKVFGNLMVDLQTNCEKLRDRAERMVMTILEMDRRDAAALIERAGGSVKVALVMGRLGVDRATAKSVLDECGGFIRKVIDRREREDT
ncbi:MAG: N-acetylmuramic acid 6-phosphate etherase [Gemmatimonadetes bacterium]|uniref:SIS domain-containing protein n=1 Tax=marine metagenome TaxID=408172 RepID=A0A381WBI6_9ZZZZ|nr:N-acetylmuramic acid 6-phosphate etherase [Gemmatimonadota bacterium]